MIIKNLIFKEGRSILYGSLALICLGMFLSYYLSFAGLVYLFFGLYFFRNPDRFCPEILNNNYNNIAVCPADGIVVAIKDLDQNNIIHDEKFAKKISIFLSPLDVHVQWAPISGKIVKKKYSEGKFMFAFVEKSSDLNERNDILIQDVLDRKMVVRQIAGTIARVIVCWAGEGDHIEAGSKYGMIKFGSRIDVFVPKDFEFNVSVGQRVYGGNTILGRWIC